MAVLGFRRSVPAGHERPRRHQLKACVNRVQLLPTNRSIATHAISRPGSTRRPEDLEYQLAEEKKELDLLLGKLGWPDALLPGDAEVRKEIDTVLQRMEALNPNPSPLRCPEAGGLVTPLLLGEWQLVYASNGTVVTRTAAAQLLLQAAQLPGVGLEDITQTLSTSPTGALATSNTAVFGLGPLGGWRVGIDGVWRDAGDGRTARVLFESVQVKPVSALGLSLPGWLPPLTLGTGGLSGPGDNRQGADWVTTYLDRDMRVGRAKSGNTFLFRKKA